MITRINEFQKINEEHDFDHLHMADDILTAIDNIVSKLDKHEPEQYVEIYSDVITILQERLNYFKSEIK